MSSVVPLRSSFCQSPDLVLSRPFPSALTTMAFDHSRRRWFETCSCKPVPRGRPSSVEQLHTLSPFGPLRSWRTIVSMIKNQPGKYTLTADDVVKMKGQGVTEKELGAMITKGSAPAASAPASGKANGPAVAIAGLDLPEDLEIGVYYKKAGKWQEMLPEVVNWKTGGVVKNIASAGMIKGDVNGHIQGTNSRNSLASPVEVVIYAPEGVAITEYQLLHLRDHADA